jgi:hypothetical protein
MYCGRGQRSRRAEPWGVSGSVRMRRNRVGKNQWLSWQEWQGSNLRPPGFGERLDDQDGREPEKPSLKVVSDNPDVDKTRPIHFAKEEAERTLVIAAATMLRMIAGSDGAATALRNDMRRALLAEDEYQALSGQWLASWERKEALALAGPDWKEDESDRRYRKYERDLRHARYRAGVSPLGCTPGAGRRTSLRRKIFEAFD